MDRTEIMFVVVMWVGLTMSLFAGLTHEQRITAIERRIEDCEAEE